MTSTINTGHIIYLDSEFLIRFFSEGAENTPEGVAAIQTMASMMASGCRIVTSQLAIDESWKVFKDITDETDKQYNRRKKLISVAHRLLFREKIRVKTYKEAGVSFKDIAPDIRKFTKKIFQSDIEIVQVTDPVVSINKALEAIDMGHAPRDSFHLAHAVCTKATHILGRDKKMLRDAPEFGLVPINFTKVDVQAAF